MAPYKSIPLLLSLSLCLISCSGSRPANLGVSTTGLAPCPSSPNCVSSDATKDSRRIAPFAIIGPAPAAWQAAREQITQLPRTRIVNESQDYLHAECHSALFGFVDDLELHLRPEQEMIAVRSAARWGYSDFGVNRRRVENLRLSLQSRGIIR